MSHPTSSWTLIPESTSAASAAVSFTPGQDYLLDADGDIDLSTGDIRFTTGLLAVAQGLWIALNMFKGEWFLNRELGIPYLPNDIVSETDAILGQRYSPLKARTAFRTAIAAVDGVESITSLAVVFNTATRTLTISFKVKTPEGTIAATEEF